MGLDYGLQGSQKVCVWAVLYFNGFGQAGSMVRVLVYVMDGDLIAQASLRYPKSYEGNVFLVIFRESIMGSVVD